MSISVFCSVLVRCFSVLKCSGGLFQYVRVETMMYGVKKVMYTVVKVMYSGTEWRKWYTEYEK